MLSIDSIRLKNLNCEIDVKDEIIFTLFKNIFFVHLFNVYY